MDLTLFLLSVFLHSSTTFSSQIVRQHYISTKSIVKKTVEPLIQFNDTLGLTSPEYLPLCGKINLLPCSTPSSSPDLLHIRSAAITASI